MKIEIDQSSGFCFGVTRAIGKAEEAAVLRRKDAFLRETATRKAVLVTFVTPDGLARNGRIGLAQSEVTCTDLFA